MKVVDEKTVFETKIFVVKEVSLEKSDGTTVVHHVIRFSRTVSVLPITPDGRIVLERQFRSAVGGWVTEVPAGKVDAGESLEETVRREIEEEIGYHVITCRELFSGWVSCGYTDEYMHYFLAIVEPLTEGKRKRFPDHDEEIETLTVTLEDACAMIERREIVDAKTIALVYAYARERNS